MSTKPLDLGSGVTYQPQDTHGYPGGVGVVFSIDSGQLGVVSVSVPPGYYHRLLPLASSPGLSPELLPQANLPSYSPRLILWATPLGYFPRLISRATPPSYSPRLLDVATPLDKLLSSYPKASPRLPHGYIQGYPMPSFQRSSPKLP